MEMSKGEFAAHIGVSAGRVSQYLKAGLIGRDALTGDGPHARIVVERAVEQLKVRRHVGQALGNGLTTRLDVTAPPSQAPADDGERTDDTAALIQLERLEQERRKNRQAERDEAVANGRLVAGEELQRQVGKAAQTMVNAFTGMAPDIANAIAAQFHVPQRDVLHLVKTVMREKRALLAKDLQLEAENKPATIETVL